jgi:Xaa-Pro aminopeptidase
MLTAEGCRRRRERLWERLRADGLAPDGPLVLADPVHLVYLANFQVDPFSLGAGFGGILVLWPDGRSLLVHDNRLPGSVEDAHVDTRDVIVWYDGKRPAGAPRQLVAWAALEETDLGTTVHDLPGHVLALPVAGAIRDLRRHKDADEVAVLRRCMRAGEAGHAWALAHLEPGMTELDVYRGVQSACTAATGRAVIVYGDFAVSPGPERLGGPPTDRVLRPGDLFILDFSVVLGGYRGDFTNTIAVGNAPSAEQMRHFDLCAAALVAGEACLSAGRACLDVYRAVRGVFEQAHVTEHFPHHAGHGLGLAHPEAPYFVEHATEKLLPGDIVTLEPGLYVRNVGGIRLEHNYLITESSPERLSKHMLALTRP